MKDLRGVKNKLPACGRLPATLVGFTLTWRLSGFPGSLFLIVVSLSLSSLRPPSYFSSPSPIGPSLAAFVSYTSEQSISYFMKLS